MSAVLVFISGVITSLIGSLVYDNARQRTGNRHLRRLLSFDGPQILFVLPHRVKEPNSIMPRIAIEDFLGMNNILRALSETGEKRVPKIRDVSNVSEEDKTKNDLVLFGSPKVNEITMQVFQAQANDQLFRFEVEPTRPGRLNLKKSNFATYVSTSYDHDGEKPENERQDMAVVMRVPNPWNPERKALVIAGIRGIGTWAAGELIRKKPRLLAHKLQSSQGNSSALIRTHYKHYNISHSELVDFVNFN